MKLIVVFFALSLITCVANAQEIINNQSIIMLIKARIDRGLILDKTKASASQFNMSTNGLIELKQALVPDPVVEAMMLASSPLPTLRNQDIIALCEGKVSRDIITRKIQYSETSFNLSTEDIVALKLAKVSDQLVKVMMVPKRGQLQSTNSNLIAGVLPLHSETLPLAPRNRFAEPGIYYEEYKVPKPQYLQLEPTTTTLRPWNRTILLNNEVVS